jgi:uncharacterized phage protein gp47/JayE
MAFTRPTVAEILDRIRGDVKGVLVDFDPFAPRTAILALIMSQTAQIHELNGRLERAARNHFGDTAELDDLVRLAAEEGLTQTLGAKAQGFARFALAAEVVPAPTAGLFLVNAAGDRYVALTFPWIAALASYVPQIQAVESGEKYNLAAGSAIDLEEPFTGIAAGLGQVRPAPDEVSAGTNDETTEAFRDRYLLHKRRAPQGGTLTDFERWTFESIANAWTRVFVVKPAALSNLVSVYAVNDAADAAGNAINRAAGDYTTAFTYINADHRRPLCADVQVAAPTLVALDPAITLIPNTTAVQDAVKGEIVQFLIRTATIGGTVVHSQLAEVISRASGETSSALTSPAADKTHSAGQLPIIGTPVFT